VVGYKGKQVRDNLHASDLVAAFWQFFLNPRSGAVYNIGGGRFANCSVIEAMLDAERAVGLPIRRSYKDEPRRGDHIWWISDTFKFRHHYPNWKPPYGITEIIEAIAEAFMSRHERSKVSSKG